MNKPPRLRAASAIGIFLSACLMPVPGAPARAADTEQYLRGYVDALLDNRFPGLGVKVKRIDAAGRVTLTSRVCLGPSQKRGIQRLLDETGRIAAIAWDSGVDCGDEPDGEPPPGDVCGLPIDIRILPEEELFAPLLADPRQPRFSLSHQWYRTPAGKFRAGSVALGEYFGLASGFLGRSGASQIGIQAAVFALFNLDAPSKDLVNADYWVGLPLTYRRGAWSFLLRVYHQSSHLGDEFILGNPGVDRVNLSYEDLEFIASHEWDRLRLYGGGGYIFRTSSRGPDLAPKHLRAGAEYLVPRALRSWDFIAAADVQASEELDWSYSRSYQAGLRFKNPGRRQVRLMLEHFRGHSPNGQFYRESLRYTGLGFYFGF